MTTDTWTQPQAFISKVQLTTGKQGGDDCWWSSRIWNVRAHKKNKASTMSLISLLFLLSFSSYQSLHKVSTKGIKEAISARPPA